MTFPTNRYGRLAFKLGVVGVALTSAAVPAAANPTTRPGGPAFGPAVLTRFAALPAQTYLSASDPSGSLLGTAAINGITPPFADQPIQGFSGIVRNSDGTFDVLSDNGYGNRANSADFVLRINRIAADFANHTIDVVGGINLTDPHGHVPYPLTRPDRVLTGSDLDVESITRIDDGSYWLGDEFGPYLLHFDRAGRLLQAPVPVPDVRAPENPAGSPNLGSSKGLEGLALSPDRRRLYPLVEGTVAGDTPGSLRLYEFDLAAGAFTDRRWVYQLDAPNYAIGDAITVDDNRLLIIERDGAQGDAAMHKKIYLADKRDRDGDGRMDKTLVADLLNIADPGQVAGAGPTFRFPFQTIENLVLLDDRTLGVLNDNNFPFSSGRTPGRPDDNEFITIRLTERLHADKRVLRG